MNMNPERIREISATITCLLEEQDGMLKRQARVAEMGAGILKRYAQITDELRRLAKDLDRLSLDS